MRGLRYVMKALCVLMILPVLLAALPSCGSGMEETFPMWRESGKEGALGRGSFALDKLNPDFEVRFEGVEFGTGSVPDQEAGLDTLLIFEKYNGDKTKRLDGARWRVDYLYRGTWYTVYEYADNSLLSMILEPGKPGGTHRYSIDSRVFQHEGSFRFYNAQAREGNYCFFTVSEQSVR